ncbi:MAG: glycosyl transferase family 90 [Bacteroidota bacterium]
MQTLIRSIYSLRHKNIKFFYYLKNYFGYLFLPDWVFRKQLKHRLKAIRKYDKDYIFLRVNYYNKLAYPAALGDAASSIKRLHLKDHKKTYFFDAYKFLRWFGRNLKCNLRSGDITEVPDVPSLLKSRPIDQNNANSVLLNLNKIRHFNFVHDERVFRNKIDKLVWRGHVYEKKPTRIRFLEQFYEHPLCNVGYTNNWGKNPEWHKERLSIDEQLKYKFILCLEGIDVASNLKWVMSSRSVAVMPRPKYETWFMEGMLRPDHHYVLIRDDFSDLEEKLNFFIQNPGEAEKIISNARAFVNQFQNQEQEELISLLVLEKYFLKTGQKAEPIIRGVK